MKEAVSNRQGAAHASTQRERAGGGSAVSLALRLLSLGPLLILILLAAAISQLTPDFLKPINIGNIIAQTAVIAIVAIGQQLAILTRGIDLSVGANLALATVIGGLVFRSHDSALLVGLAMVASATLVGAINGVVFVYGRLPHPFIITLATLSICRGLALELAIGHTTMRGMPDWISTLGGSEIFGVPNSFFVVLAVTLAALIMTKAMVWGRWIYAVGGNPEAALEMGIPVKGVLVSTYVISGFCAGIGAIVLAGRTGASSPLYGNLLELDTIAAVIIGGASFLGGRGQVGHALVGAVMIGVIRNALNLLSVDVFFQMIAIGLIIVVAVEADVLRSRLEARARSFRRPGPNEFGLDRPGSLSASGREAIRRRACSQGRQPGGVPQRSSRFARRQRGRQVDARQMHQRRLCARCGRNPARRRAVPIHSPAATRHAGIETVYQDLALFDNLTPSQNFYCGREIAFPAWLPRGLRFLNGRTMDREAAAVLERLRVKLPNLDAPVALMSGGQRQADSGRARDCVRAQGRDPRRADRRARGARVPQGPRPDRAAPLEGNAVILITHNMEHVVELADRAIVLRHGRKVGELKPDRANQKELVALIVGAEA